MSKKNIAIIVCVIVVAIIVLLLILFGNKKYEVSFDSKGGSEVATQTIKAFGKATEPEDPVLEGYVFDAWYYEDEEFDFDTKINKDMTLEARWIGEGEGTFIVSFSTSGGSSVASVKVNDDGTIDRPKDPTREGYKFVSWQLDGKDFDFDSKVTKSITLVAKWEKTSDDDKDDTDNDEDTVAVTSVTLSKKSVSLNVGESTKVTATVKPSNATNKTVTWKSSNTAVATVDKNGNIKAVGAGSATITATAGGKSAKVTVTITAPTASTPSEPDTPNDEPQEEVVTCTNYEWGTVVNSIDQGRLYIVCSNGEHVAGTVTMTLIDGSVLTEDIPKEGEIFSKTAISSIVVNK